METEMRMTCHDRGPYSSSYTRIHQLTDQLLQSLAGLNDRTPRFPQSARRHQAKAALTHFCLEL